MGRRGHADAGHADGGYDGRAYNPYRGPTGRETSPVRDEFGSATRVSMTMSNPPASVEVIRVRMDETRRPLALAALVVLGLTVAVLKPWGEQPPPTRDGHGAPAGISTVTASQAPEQQSRGVSGTGPANAAEVPAKLPQDVAIDDGATAPNDECFAGLAWRLFTVQRDFGRLARWWLRLDTAPQASGPLDPSIPVIHISTQQALGLGFCAPYRRGGGTPVEGVAAWRLDAAGRAVPVHLDPLPGVQPVDGHGALYAPPTPAARTSEAAWQPGRYVFQVASQDIAAPVWFAVALETSRSVQN